MKVVIVTSIKNSYPYVDELSNQLIEKGIEVELFDMFDMYTVKFVNDKECISYHVEPLLLRKICAVRYLGTILRLFFYKFYFLIKPLKCDHISIHYALHFYSFFIFSLKKMSNFVSICIWGSDFYRISDKKRNKMNKLFDKCDSIIISNPKMSSEFSNYYENRFLQKIRNVGFGIGKLDLIENVSTIFSKRDLKNSLNLPEDKLIITIGYNGLEAQQHLLVLEALTKIPKYLLNDLFIIIPFGYGGNKTYKNSIINKIEDLGVQYIIFDSFISDEDVAKIRICTDFVINAQTTDAASASLQEHLYSGNILLAGNWLPYDYFLDIGIKLWTFEKSELNEKIKDILVNFSSYSNQVVNNREYIKNLSSWNSRIVQWINVFENKL